jgi:hypothetical protein
VQISEIFLVSIRASDIAIDHVCEVSRSAIARSHEVARFGEFDAIESSTSASWGSAHVGRHVAAERDNARRLIDLDHASSMRRERR